MRRVGSLKERRVSVRLLAATNRDLAQDVEDGRFRQDLFYRINVMSLELPPLRERAGDVPLLVAHFLGPDWNIEDEALRRIEAYHWPGNVRQLINAIERAKIMGDDRLVRVRDLPREIAVGRVGETQQAAVLAAEYADSSHHPLRAGGSPAARGSAPAPLPPPASVDDLSSIERAKVVEILRRERGNKSRAAQALGIDRRKLYRLLDRYGIEPSEWSAGQH